MKASWTVTRKLHRLLCKESLRECLWRLEAPDFDTLAPANRIRANLIDRAKLITRFKHFESAFSLDLFVKEWLHDNLKSSLVMKSQKWVLFQAFMSHRDSTWSNKS